MPWSKINDCMEIVDSKHICPGKHKEAVEGVL